MSDINTLRSILFDTLRGLQDEENPMEIDRAKAVVEVSQALINAAKVEIDFIKQTSARAESSFFNAALPSSSTTNTGVKQTRAVPGGTITSHRLT